MGRGANGGKMKTLGLRRVNYPGDDPILEGRTAGRERGVDEGVLDILAYAVASRGWLKERGAGGGGNT